MKNKLFHRKLYLEGLRQLRTIGILSLVIQLLFAFLIPLGTYLNNKNSYENGILYNMGGESVIANYITTMRPLSSHSYLLLFVFVFVPAMVITLFRFLNNRESCDFYHSIPQSRTCLLFSYTAAVSTYVAITFLLTGAVSFFTYKACRTFIIIRFDDLAAFFINLFVIALLIISILLLAHSLCGNMMSVAVVFLIILVTPRIILQLYYSLLHDSLSYLTDDILGVFQVRHNLFYCLLLKVFDYSQGNALYELGGATVYTAILTILLFVAAVYAFKTRKSETAGSAMNSRILQLSFRTLFVMILCLIPISLIFIRIINRYSGSYYLGTDLTNTMLVFYIVISYLISILGLFMYEFLTTKSASNGLKALRSIPVIILLNFAVLGLLSFSEHHYKNLRFSADDISGITLDNAGNIDDYNNNYFSTLSKACRITDKEFIKLLCDSFNDYADTYISYSANEFSIFDDVTADETAPSYVTYITADFHGTSGHKMYFGLTAENYQKMLSMLSDNTIIREAYTVLPDYAEVAYLSASVSLDSDKTKNLYETLREELQSDSIDYSAWVSSLSEPYNALLWIDFFYTDENDVSYDQVLPITPAVPKTYALFLEYSQKNAQEDFQNLKDGLEKYQQSMDTLTENNYLELTIRGFDQTTSMTMETSTILEHKDAFLEILTLLSDNMKSFSDYEEDDDSYLNCYLYYSLENTSTTLNVNVCIPEDILEQIKTIYSQNFSSEE